jgi:hypothetical protein
VFGNTETMGNQLVAQSFRDHIQHLEFALAQRFGQRLRARLGSNSAAQAKRQRYVDCVLCRKKTFSAVAPHQLQVIKANTDPAINLAETLTFLASSFLPSLVSHHSRFSNFSPNPMPLSKTWDITER